MASNLDRRSENLAFVFQELLTVGERLRANRQEASHAETFREQLRSQLTRADSEALKRGYNKNDIDLAKFAVIAFLDESILNLRNPVFADWPRKPLQEEYYRHHIAGEIFFKNLEELLGRADSQELADVLEVYQLCLLLGFAGRYSLSGHGELRAFMQRTGEKIARIRQLPPDLSPLWRLPNENIVTATRDPWVKRLLAAALACALLALLLFVVFKMTLGSGIRSMERI
jgi:type IV / VI secretion system protein, DotU family